MTSLAADVTPPTPLRVPNQNQAALKGVKTTLFSSVSDDDHGHQKGAIQLVDSTFSIREDGYNLLVKPTNVKMTTVIAVAGIFRSGKSTILNKMASSLQQGGGATASIEPFVVGHKMDAQTKGIYFHQPTEDVVLLDSEGLQSQDDESVDGNQLLAFALSSCTDFVYNVDRVLKKKDIDLLVKACEEVKSKNLISAGAHWPNLHILLRNFQSEDAPDVEKVISDLEKRFPDNHHPFAAVHVWDLASKDDDAFDSDFEAFMAGLLGCKQQTEWKKFEGKVQRGVEAFGKTPLAPEIAARIRKMVGHFDGNENPAHVDDKVKMVSKELEIVCWSFPKIAAVMKMELDNIKGEFAQAKEVRTQALLQDWKNKILAPSNSAKACMGILGQCSVCEDRFPGFRKKLDSIVIPEIKRREQEEVRRREQEETQLRQREELERREREAEAQRQKLLLEEQRRREQMQREREEQERQARERERQRQIEIQRQQMEMQREMERQMERQREMQMMQMMAARSSYSSYSSYSSSSSSSHDGPRCKDGSLDMRFAANRGRSKYGD